MVIIQPWSSITRLSVFFSQIIFGTSVAGISTHTSAINQKRRLRSYRKHGFASRNTQHQYSDHLVKDRYSDHRYAIHMLGTMVLGIWIANHLNNEQVQVCFSDVLFRCSSVPIFKHLFDSGPSSPLLMKRRRAYSTPSVHRPSLKVKSVQRAGTSNSGHSVPRICLNYNTFNDVALNTTQSSDDSGSSEVCYFVIYSRDLKSDHLTSGLFLKVGFLMVGLWL